MKSGVQALLSGSKGAKEAEEWISREGVGWFA